VLPPDAADVNVVVSEELLVVAVVKLAVPEERADAQEPLREDAIVVLPVPVPSVATAVPLVPSLPQLLLATLE
jgi:hypothetical protein